MTTPQALAAEWEKEADKMIGREAQQAVLRCARQLRECARLVESLDLTAARAGAREEAAKVADYFADKWKRLRDEQADVADKVIYNERWDASATIAESIRRLAARKAGSEG
jgi:hypothetical protein